MVPIVPTGVRVEPETAARPTFARGPVLLAVLARVVLLAATSNAYGYHRDELYFRELHPAWGYIDQPPLTPLLARAMQHLVAEPIAVCRGPRGGWTRIWPLLQHQD
jgi:hypothetical protein